LGLASSELVYEPLGVALVLSAWNYPIYTAIPQAAAAICAGNCLILKPSELAPFTSNVLKKLFDKYMDPSILWLI
jgi:aldehyde dehydrogenase (NAD+)